MSTEPNSMDAESARADDHRREFLALAGIGASSVALLSAFSEGGCGPEDPAVSARNSVDAALAEGRDVIDTFADLRSVRPRAKRAALFVRGHSAPGDGGQGLFWFDRDAAAPDNDGFILAPNDGTAGRWLRDFDGFRVNVKWFGARGDDTTDDTDAIQRAVDSARNLGAVFFPAGTYRLSSPIRVINSNTSAENRSIRLMGANGAARSSQRTRLKGALDSKSSTLLEIRSRNVIVEHLEFVADPAFGPLESAIRVAFNPTGAPPSNNVFRHVSVLGGYPAEGDQDGAILHGIFVEDAPIAANHDFFRFVKCSFRKMTTSGVFIDDDSGQSVGHTFDDCRFLNVGTPDTPRGAGIIMRRGSFRCIGCFFRGLERVIYTQFVDGITLMDTETERCKRLVDTTFDGAGNTDKEIPVSILGGRFNIRTDDFLRPFRDNTPFDGDFVRYTASGQVVIQGCAFDSGATHFPTFHLRVNGRLQRAPSLISIGNRFPTLTPYDTASGFKHRLTSLGNNGIGAGGTAERVPLPDIHAAQGTAMATALHLQGLAGSPTNNLRGRLAFNTGEVSAVVTLPLVEPTSDYHVVATQHWDPSIQIAPSVPAPNVSITIMDQTTSEFRVRLSAPAPEGFSVAWALVR